MSTSVTRRRSHPSVGAWVLLGVLVLGAVTTASVMVWSIVFVEEAPGEPRWDPVVLVGGVVFVVWAMVPFAAMAATALLADLWARGGRGVVAVLAVGVAALVVSTAAVLADFVTSTSSTDGLVFIFLPLYQLVLVALTAAAAFGLAALVRWRRSHRPPHSARSAENPA